MAIAVLVVTQTGSGFVCQRSIPRQWFRQMTDAAIGHRGTRTRGELPLAKSMSLAMTQNRSFIAPFDTETSVVEQASVPTGNESHVEAGREFAELA